MAYCNQKMNLRGTIRCEVEVAQEGDTHEGAHSATVAKAPKRNGKVMRGIIVAGDTIGKKRSVKACSHFMHEAQTKTVSVMTRKAAAERKARIEFILDVADARGSFNLDEILELGELNALDQMNSLMKAMAEKDMASK